MNYVMSNRINIQCAECSHLSDYSEHHNQYPRHHEWYLKETGFYEFWVVDDEKFICYK